MIYILCTIHDRSIDAYVNLHCVRAEGQAIRQFMDAINNKDGGSIHQHPDDYDLYRVGTYNDETGECTPEPRKKIADGKQLSIQGE